MNTMTVVMGIPETIRLGLESGLYERVGGVVRDTQTKQMDQSVIVCLIPEQPISLGQGA